MEIKDNSALKQNFSWGLALAEPGNIVIWWMIQFEFFRDSIKGKNYILSQVRNMQVLLLEL